jgi:hypothetical protein
MFLRDWKCLVCYAVAIWRGVWGWMFAHFVAEDMGCTYDDRERMLIQFTRGEEIYVDKSYIAREC